MSWSAASIPTVYRGMQFRSRIEARWAAFFDLLGWHWNYEPVDFAGWIPDFVLAFKQPMLVEVKADLSLRELKSHVTKIERANARNNFLLTYDVLLVGATLFESDKQYVSDLGGITFGLLSEKIPAGAIDNSEDFHTWDYAHFHRCRECGKIGFHSRDGSYECRVCGGYDGDHHLLYIDPAELTRFFRMASNAVQWKSPIR